MMHLSVHEMCMLSAAGGWIAAWLCGWAFDWLKRDVHDLSNGELVKLLTEIRNAVIQRGGLKESQRLEKRIDDDLA